MILNIEKDDLFNCSIAQASILNIGYTFLNIYSESKSSLSKIFGPPNERRAKSFIIEHNLFGYNKI